MTRLRAFSLLFPLAILSQTAHVVRAAPNTGKLAWSPGIYIGTISIDAHEYVSLKPLPEGVLHEEHELEILFSTGRMQIVVNSNGWMSYTFSLPIRFKYMDWSQVEDVGTGICEGQRIESTGHGTLRMSSPPLAAPTGATFSGKTQPFKLDGFTGNVRQFGKNCPEIDGELMRSAMEAEFAAMFANSIVFEILMTKGNIRAGYCRLPGYELEGDHSFDCTWYVQYHTPKRK